ncbi:unnamed protein product [Porites lobata]|uniref:Centromere protein Q n=1 Tax=Porites lobata TaxID=104759 RepID=A0ABN8Q9Z4_9CNID|nr:unnamed protein product [Porites lobata]
MAKRRSKIVYALKSRRRSSGTDRSQSASSYEQDTKETSRRNKRSGAKNEAAEASSSNLSSNVENSQQHSKWNKRSGSATDKGSSPHKPSTSKQAEGGTEDTRSDQKVVEKKRTYPKRNKTVKADEAPERIRDMTVTKKAYAKWKPLSSSTKKYTKQVLESTILSVINSVGKESKKSDLQVHLKQLSDRIIKRLDHVKGPTQKGDYCKMEAESHELEDAVISFNRQTEALEKELEEQTRLFEQDEQMLESFSNQEQDLQQLHPLLQKQPANALNLPSLSSAAVPHEMSSIFEIPTSLESSGERLAQSLARLSDRAQQVGFTTWLESLSDRTNS